MKTWVQWLKFNLVGAIGVPVQLAAVAVLNRWIRGHALYASAGAVELTLLHNFVWHVHYTWRDAGCRDAGCRDAGCSKTGQSASCLPRLLRFQLSNGVVSIVGSLVILRLLTVRTHLPLWVCHLIAITGCSTANFCLSRAWVFAAVASPALMLYPGERGELSKTAGAGGGESGLD